MEDRHFRNKVEDFHQFLTEVCGEFKEKCETEDYVPVRLVNPRITPQELEGECIEWCREFLSTRGCPLSLQALITHEVYEQLTSGSLENFYTEDRKNDSPRIVTTDNVDNIDDNKRKDADKDNIEYSAEKLHSHVDSLLQTICEHWMATMPEIRIDGSLPVVSFHAIKNTRRKMEDKHVIVPDLNALFGLKDHPPESFYAVFDGHAGIEAALFASKHFHSNLVHHCDLAKDPASACKSAFKVTDEQFIPKAKRERWRSGSTGVTALVRGSKLYLSWLGDSQAVLVRDGRCVTTMEPHKPDREDERERIESAGGFVVLMGDLWRVGGNLAVSRAIGDVGYKPFISSDAEVLEMEMEGTEDYMVLACDGLWDAVTNEELPQLVFNYLRDNNNDRMGVAKYLVQYAKDNESMDNISVIVVFFRENIGEPVADAGFFNMMGSGDSQGSNESGENSDKSKGDNSPNCGKGNNSSWQQGGSNEKGDNSGITDAVDDLHDNDIEHNEEMLVDKSGLKPLNLVDIENVDSSRTDDLVHAQNDKENSHLSYMERSNTDDSIEKEDTPPVVEDLDQYGVFNTRLIDGPIDLSFVVDSNSSLLVRDIADSVYNQTQRLSERTGISMNSQVQVTPKSKKHRKTSTDDLDFSPYFNQEPFKGKKKLKKIVKPGRSYPSRDKSRRGREKSPVYWAFTGNNRATVQNHRLNLALKGIKGSKPTLGELTLADKAPPRLSDRSNNKFAQQYSSTENIHEIANITLNHGRLEHLPPPRSKLSSKSMPNVSGLTIFGSKASLQTESEKFLTTLRPRKPLKPITTVIHDAPPTPFMSNKLASLPRYP
ncbi:Protein phosphatase 1E [Mactra antiquata]